MILLESMETFAIVLVVVAILLIISGLAYGAWWWLSSTRRLQNIRRRSLSAMELMEKATVVYNQSDVLNNIVASTNISGMLYSAEYVFT